MKIKNKFSDLWAEIDDETGWTILYLEGENTNIPIIVLGKYPNARFDILKRLFAELELKELSQKGQEE